MKGFNIAPQPGGSGTLPPVAEFIASLQQAQHENSHPDLFGSTLSGIFGPGGATPKKSPHHTSTNSVPGLATGSRQSRGTRGSSRKKRWGTLIEAAKAGRVSRLIGKLKVTLFSIISISLLHLCRESIEFYHYYAISHCSNSFKNVKYNLKLI